MVEGVVAVGRVEVLLMVLLLLVLVLACLAEVVAGWVCPWVVLVGGGDGAAAVWVVVGHGVSVAVG